MFSTSVTREATSELGGIITQIFDDNPSLAAAAAKKGAEFMRTLVMRSLKSTGYTAMATMRTAINTNAYGLEPLRRHPWHGAVMATTIRQYFSTGKSLVPNVKYKTLKGRIGALKFDDAAPGRKFGKLFQYVAQEISGGHQFLVGVVPKEKGGRASNYWANAFAEFQEAGTVDIPYSGQTGQLRGIHGFMGTINMPITNSTTLSRPARPFMQRAQSALNLAAIFGAKLDERLRK